LGEDMHSWPKDHAMPKPEKSAFVDTLKGLLCVFDFRQEKLFESDCASWQHHEL
jgi:hypothetical protein